jgi:uncharacterized coiled-coil DUF342 family protein
LDSGQLTLIPLVSNFSLKTGNPMNKEARLTIKSQIEAWQEAVEIFNDQRDEIIRQFEELRDEEQEKFDNLSEGLQQSEKGTNLEDAVSELDSIIGELESVEIPELDFSKIQSL